MTYDTENMDVPTDIQVRMHNSEASDDYEDFGNLETIDVVSVLSYDTRLSIIESEDQKQQGIHRFVHALRSFQWRLADKETSEDNNNQQPTKHRLFTRRQRNFQNVSLRREPMINVKGEKEGWNHPSSYALDSMLETTPMSSKDESEVEKSSASRFATVCKI